MDKNAAVIADVMLINKKKAAEDVTFELPSVAFQTADVAAMGTHQQPIPKPMTRASPQNKATPPMSVYHRSIAFYANLRRNTASSPTTKPMMRASPQNKATPPMSVNHRSVAFYVKSKRDVSSRSKNAQRPTATIKSTTTSPLIRAMNNSYISSKLRNTTSMHCAIS